DSREEVLSPVTHEVSGVSLRSGLRLMLASLGLTYVVTDDVLLIASTPGEEHFRTAIYPVGDLLELPEKASAAEVSEASDTLLEKLMEVVAPDTWDQVGGRGGLEPFVNRRALVAAQS